MVKLTIDHIPVEVQEGTSVMEAAAGIGITIPAMCFRPGFSNHPSCMVCLVKDRDREHLVPSCAMPVSEGMDILTSSAEVLVARREALELLLSDHAGDCEAPCRLSCPAFMNIPLMNRLIAAGDFEQALRIVREEIALPLVLGYICPAPCEKACRRRPIDQAVSICLLKRSTGHYKTYENHGLPPVPENNGKRIAIIGTGPAGLSAAFNLLRYGYGCVLFDRNPKAGGAMRYEIPDNQLPKEMLDAEIGIIEQMGAEFRLGTEVSGDMFQHSIVPGFDAVILATGNQGSMLAENFGLHADEHGHIFNKVSLTTSIPGVFVIGNNNIQQKMAVQSVAKGKIAAQVVGVYCAKPIIARSGHGFNSSVGHLFEPEWTEYLKESIPDHRVEPAGGSLQGLSREEAMHEAQRCLHCDCRKPVSCKLRKYADESHANRKIFAGPVRKLLTKSMQHEIVVYETEKCIRCGLCVAITEKHGESIGLTFAGRGFDVRISAPFNQTTREALVITAAACVEACPTGALAFKNQEERMGQ